MRMYEQNFLNSAGFLGVDIRGRGTCRAKWYVGTCSGDLLYSGDLMYIGDLNSGSI